MPFGDELFIGTGGRTAAQHYLASPAAETLNTLFSGKYRDPELVSSAMASGLDFFGARYFSGAQRRMTSPDSFMIMMLAEDREQLNAYLGNPQNWNRYAYALNNPLRYTDPTGLDPISLEDCQNNPECTVVKVNVILDQNANIYDQDGNLQQDYQDKLDSQLAQAADEYGNANIAFDVNDTSGTITADDTVTGGVAGALNVVVNDSRDSYASNSWIGSSGNSYTRLNIGTSETNTIAHEFAHHVTGDTRSWGIPWLSNAIADYNNDIGRAFLRNWNTPGGRVLRTVDPFLYLHRRDVVQNARRSMELVEAMTISRVVDAMPILLRAFRPVFRAIAWALFSLLLISWVIEAMYCVRNYAAGGWPALIGYVQHISQGCNAAPVSWSAVVGMHVAALAITLLLAWYLHNSSRRIVREHPHAESTFR